MYDPQIRYGLDMIKELFNKHAHELYYIELKGEKIKYLSEDGCEYEQIYPNVVAEFKR